MSNTSTFNILDLHEYILLEIFKFLNATDLWLLSKTCGRLNDFVKKECFWIDIDARDSPNTTEKLEYCAENFGKTTRDVRICADGRHLAIMSAEFFRCLHLTSITVLALENQKICGNEIKLSYFPANLTELSLKKTYITEINEFLPNNFHLQLKKLKVLILDQCCWITRKILTEKIAKIDSLEILSLYKYKALNEVPMSVIEGFLNLRIVDCRFSNLEDMFLKNLSRRPKIKEIYFQNYPTTYFPEKNRRNVEISSGLKMLKHSYIKEIDDIPLWDENAVRSYFGSNVKTLKRGYFNRSLSDEGTELYTHSKYIEDNFNFESVLYKRPYNECVCEYNSTTKVVMNEKPEINHDDDLDQYVCKDDYYYTLDPACFAYDSENSNKSEEEIAIEEYIDPESHIRRKRKHPVCGTPDIREWMRKRRYEDYVFSKYNNVSLTKISLRGFNRITDTTLQHLNHLHLSLLDVTGTDVTTEGVIKFAIDNVQCRIIHETMCTCPPNLHF